MATGSGWAESLVGLPGRMTPLSNAALNVAAGAPKSLWVSVASYLFAIAIIVGILLLFVHFTIRPIFQFTPGGQGILPIPGFKDSRVYWKKQKDVAILNEQTMGTAKIPSQNWSFTLDLFVKNPTTLHSSNIPVFQREQLLGSSTSQTQSNAHIYLVPGTNDLIVGVTNTMNNAEDVVLSNVPVQAPFRVGVVILDVAMEVYINGRLVKTRAFDAPPANFTGRFVPPQGTAADLVKVRNLQIWSRPATASEIRHATPGLMHGSEFQHEKMDGASTSSCLQTLEGDGTSALLPDATAAATAATAAASGALSSL
jgi:hypothetical protein